MGSSRGTAIFLILIAVALFAALSYAVTQSGRGGGTIQREQDILYAAQMSQAIGNLKQGVLRLNLSGVPFSSMQFYSDVGGACGATYQLCSTGSDCVFAPEGGGVTLSKPPAGAIVDFDNGFALPGQPATLWTTSMWLDCNEDLYDWGLGTSAPDRTFYFMDVRESVCRAYNKAIGVDGIPNQDAGVDVTGNELSYCYRQIVGVNAGEYEIFDILYVQ